MRKDSWTRWISARSDPVPQKGSLFDGVSARAHEVLVEGIDASLRLHSAGWSDEVPISKLRSLARDAKRLRVGRSDVDGWSLVLDQPVADDLLALLPAEQRYGRWIDRIGLLPALGVLGVVTASVVIIGYTAPQWIAPHVPFSWERRLGSATVGDFGPRRCRGAQGEEALNALVEKVAPGAAKGPDGIRIAALDVPIFNAAALPGGYIVVLKPAITETNPDALAGVIAHEVAHVRRRHVTKALIRELGIGALIRLFAGDVGANAEQLLDLSYSRADEAQADADAMDMLRRANIDPRPTAALFRRLATQSPDFSAEFLQSHPLSSTRARGFAATFDPKAHYIPVLSGAQANALSNICLK